MKQLEFKININCTAERLWFCLWESEYYKQWTSVFTPGSFYKTTAFTQGSNIHFLSPEGHGMYSRIETLEPNKYIAFKHLGDIKDFQELPLENNPPDWMNALETYTITQLKQGVELHVKADTIDDCVSYMEKTFPLALLELKKIAE